MRTTKAPRTTRATRLIETARHTPAVTPTVPLGVDTLRERYEVALASGLDRREALRLASRECGISRKEAYRILKTD